MNNGTGNFTVSKPNLFYYIRPTF